MNRKFLGIGMTSQRTRDRLIKRLEKEGIKNQQVLDVMRKIPRHIFVDEALASRSYEDTALPIGHSQTISQPYIVAKMTETIIENVNPLKVLEIGTGSGYQTAVISQFAELVYSIERIQPLLVAARSRFQELQINNIRASYSDGTLGWPQNAPYDAILVTAAPSELPKLLLDQLAENGCMIAPIGPRGAQELVLVKKSGAGYKVETLEHVSFVPLLRGTQ